MERMIYYLPIELLEERYSNQWHKWFMEAFEKQKKLVTVIGDMTPHKIKQGQFLDVFETHRFKFDQLQRLLAFLEDHPEPCTVFFMDLWFPGLECLAYIRDTLKRDIRIKGILHAGTYDPHDFLTQSGCAKWGCHLETSWLRIVDEVIVATNFHKDLIENNRGRMTADISVIDFPVFRDEERAKLPKQSRVVFPHRLAPEKNPQCFETFQHRFEEKYGTIAEWVRTKDVCKTKEDYYDLLAQSKVAVSIADQETFGIAMLEALNLGCIPVAPNRLSYQETLKEYPLYDSMEEAVDLIYKAITGYEFPKVRRYFPNVDKIVEAI